jgi:hypothetical protein
MVLVNHVKKYLLTPWLHIKFLLHEKKLIKFILIIHH